MLTKRLMAQAIWIDEPENVSTPVGRVFLGPFYSLGIYLGTLRISRNGNKSDRVEYQRWTNPILLFNPSGSTRFVSYDFILWHNDIELQHEGLVGKEGTFHFTISREGVRIATEVPAVMNQDMLRAYQDDLAIDKLHAIPFSITDTHESITDDNFGEDVRVAIVQELEFEVAKDRDIFIYKLQTGIFS